MKHHQYTPKTNAARLLDSLGISYELRAYEIDPDDLTAVSVARKIAMPIEQVFKTLLTRTSENTHLLAVVPGDAELDLKKLAVVAGVRKAELAAVKDVEPLTGYIRGGVTVLAAKKPFPAFADETLELFHRISVSAGQRGLQLVLSPADYLLAAAAQGTIQVADLTKAPSPHA